MTHVRQSRITGSFLLLILLLSFTDFLIAQDQCLTMDKVYPNQERTDNLLHGDFNGDNIQDLVLVPRIGNGSIRIMYGSSSGLELKDSITLQNYYHVSSVGNIQGDSFDDLMISSGNQIFLYKGGPAKLEQDEDYTITVNELIGINSTDVRGYAVGYTDQNNNGNKEIIITAGATRNDEDYVGWLMVAEFVDMEIRIIKSVKGQDFLTNFITPTKNIGDLNNDGYPEILINRYFFNIEIYYGGPEYFSPDKKAILTEDFRDEPIFNNVGDVNNDGFNDLLISTSQVDPHKKSAWLYLGSANKLDKPAWSKEGYPGYYLFEGFGQNSGPVGDVNGDGYSDFYVAGGNSAYSLIYFGNSDVNQINPGVRFGFNQYQIIDAGDLNGDGYSDYAIGHTLANNQMAIGIVNGNLTGMNIVPCLKSEQPVAQEFHARYGQSAGDVNKDGYDDIILGHDNLDESGWDHWGMIAVVTGAPVGTGSGGMGYGGEYSHYFGDQFGRGDFNGDGFSDIIAGKYYFTSVLVFYGSDSGMKNQPDTILKEQQYAGWGESLEDIGDLNADGFDDFLSYGFRGMTLVLGSPNGPKVFESWNYPSFYAYRAGDVNNDGYTDFFLKVPEGYRLFYGSQTGPVISSFISPLAVISGGDINGDGYDDMLTSDNFNKSIGILFGSSSGYTEQKNVILNAFSPNGIGDFNGDGYDDIGVSNSLDEEKFPGSAWRVDIYLGSATGLVPTIFTTIRSDKKHQNLEAQPRIGDFNKDGFEDILVSSGYEVWLIYGLKGISNITCPADAILYSDSTCTVQLNGFDPPGDPALYKFKVSGTSGFEGTGSINGIFLQTGEYTVTYSLITNENMFCIFRIKVLDTISPVLILPGTVNICTKGPASLNVPILQIKDSCQIKNITYSLTGATYRNGSGTNASGMFNTGETIITWTVTDSSGNISMKSMIVSVLETNFIVKIPNSYQINPQQSQANTIYLGYGNNTLRLTAYEASSSKHSYRWSNGDTTRFTRITHNIPGRYKYSVLVTNKSGCTSRADVFIKVVDNYCPNPLKAFITKYFPQLLNEPWIQALIASTSQIYMCYNGSTVCVSPAEIPAMVSNGARLGKCGIVYESNDMITAKEEMNSVGVLTLTASPNPSGHEFTLKIDGTNGKPYTLRIINDVGIPIFMKQGITENVVRAGDSFQKGLYFAEVICGNERKVIKLLKVR